MKDNEAASEKEVYRPKYPVQTLEKTIKILDYLKTHSATNGITLSKISEGVDMPISGVHRILDTLYAYNYVERGTNSNTYKLGWELFELGKNIPKQHTIASSNYLPYLEALCNKYNETINLGILNNLEVVILNRIEPLNPDMRLTTNVQIGGRGPLYVMGMGKLFLSDMTDEEIRHYYEIHNITRRTKYTIITPEQMMNEVKKIRENGYAAEMEEYCDNLGCVAVPIRDYTNKIIAAISMSGETSHFDETRLKYIIPDMQEACAHISKTLGYNR